MALAQAPALETPSQPLAISFATPADAAEVKRLLQACGLPAGDVRDDLAGLEFLVARDHGTIVGAAALEPLGRHALLRSVAVAEASRRKGVARALCDRLLQSARDRKLERLYLLTTTAPEYFARLGFSRIAREDAPAEVRATQQFASLCPASAIVMARALRPNGRA